MPETTLTLQTPEETWINDVSVAYPDAIFRVLTVIPDDGDAFALLELTSEDIVGILSDLEQHDNVTDVELLWKRDGAATIQIESATTSLLEPASNAGVPLQTPFRIQNGEARWKITTSNARLTALGENLDAADINYSVTKIQDSDAQDDSVLTDRQAEAMALAAEMGYYETPRGATLTDVAAELEVTKSTCSDILHRAESNIIAWIHEETTLLAEAT